MVPQAHFCKTIKENEKENECNDKKKNITQKQLSDSLQSNKDNDTPPPQGT